MSLGTQTSNNMKQLSDGGPDGTTMGQSASDKVSFYGVTPIIQRASANQAAISTVSVTNVTAYGFANSTVAASIVTLVNEMQAALVAIGIIKGSA